MANDEASDGSWSFQPKILYIKCKKGQSKEKIQDSIAHSLKEVSENCDRDLPLSDFHVESLTSGDATRDGDIAQVAIGPRYIGVLLKNGLVYRVRCVSKTPRKVKLSSTRTNEVPFSVSSDRSYARQLQERLNGRPPGTSGRYRRLRMYLDQMPTASGEASPVETNTRNRDFHMFPGLIETRGGTSQSRASNGSGNESVMSETQVYTASNLASGRTRPLSSETTLSPTTDPTFSFLSANQRTLLDNANERIRRENASSNGAVSTPPRPTVSANIHQTARRTLALAQILQQQSEMLRNFVGNQQQTSTSRTLPSSFSRIQLHTPVIRTYYPACSYGRDLLPSRYMAGTIENRRITPVFTRRGRSFPAPSIVRQLSIENPVPVFIQVGGDGSTKKQSGEKKGKRPESKKDFDWPVIGDMEWLQTASGKDVKFTKIVAMTSAFVLITDSGQLFEWLYEEEPSSEERNHITPGYFETSRYSVPKAMPHPLSCELGLKDKRVCLIATSGIRASVLTTSGHLCTFYDKLVKDCKPGQPPSLIQELSHSALLFPALVGASIVSLDCHEFYSAVMTSSGNCYWWGLLPGAERRDLEEKLSKIKQEVHLSVGDKVKLQKIAKGSPGTLVYKIHDSLGPCVGQIMEYEDATMESANRLKVEIVASGVEISTVNMNESETGSLGSSQDPSRMGSSPSPTMATPTQLPPLVDTWDLSEIVFLEDEQPCLGVVVGTDGPHVIVDTSQGATFYKTKLKIFKTSELQELPNKTGELEGTSTVLKKEQSIYERFLQSVPKSVMESCRVSCSNPVASTGVTKRTLKSLNYKAISMACTKEGVVLLVRSPTDDKVYYLGPSCEHLGDCSKRFTCSSEVSSTLGNGQVSVTVKAESVLGRDSALHRNETNSPIGENVGMKRKLSSSDDDDDDEHDHTSADFCKSPVPEAAFPRLVYSSSLCGSILLDSNGCFFPRTLNTKLNGFHSLEISPFQCFDMGERKVAFENEDYTVLVVPLVFKQQSLVRAIQTGLTSEVQKVLKNLEDMTTMNSGKGGKIKGKKKVAVQQQTQDGPVAVDKETSSFGHDIIPAVSAVLSEKVSGNRNILHLCCSNLCIKAEQQRSPIDDVLSAYKSDDEKDENKDDDISILQTLLKHPLFGNEIMGKLNEKDVNGYTPFLLSLRCNNFKASLYILDYLKEKEATGTLVDWKSMVYCCTSSGETPLHIVAMKSCAGLGLTGLGNSLIVLNLPSNYTPRMLLKLFQARYPSAYRAAIPPLEDVERAHSFTVWQKRERKLRGPSVAKSWKSSESSAASKSSLQVPIVPSSASSMRYGARLRDNNGQRREALEGMVTFADHKEMRKALCEMDKHVVSNEMGHPDVGVTSVVQHILHVKLAKLNAENNKDSSSQMEMEYNGILYGVTSTGLGCSPKINKKNKSLEASEETQKVEEDKLVSKLVGRLLENPEVALMTNGEEETALAFLVNYCKWIKPTENQKKRFKTYCQSTNNDRYSNSSPEKTTNTQDSDSPALSKPGVGASSSVSMFPGLEEESPCQWADFMTELKNNVSNLVKSLETIEKVGGSLNTKDDPSTSPSPASTATDSQGSKQTGAYLAGVRRNSGKTNAGSAKDGEQAFGSGKADSVLGNNDLIDLASESVDPVATDLPPVLLQLAKNWPCVAKTVLGMAIDDETILGTLNPILQTATAVGKGDECVSETSDLDFFVQELLSDADEVVLDTIAGTIVDELNKHSFSFKDYLHGNNHAEHDWSAARLALHVGQRFLRSVTRQLCFLLSHNGMVFVELPNATNERTAGRRRNATEIKQRARRVLSAFSWLSVYELVEAAEAVVSPFRDGVAKPQRSTGKDFGNVNNPVSMFHNTFPPQYGAPRGRPGIRVFGDQASSGGTNHLRTAPIRVSSDGDLQQSHHLVGVRLLDVDESSASESKSDGSSRRTQNRLFGMSRRQPSPLPTQTADSDSDSDDDSRDRISDETDMVIDNDDRTGGPTITGITHEHPFAWALDGRLTSSAENSSSGRGINFGVPVGNISPPSVHAGNCYLARMFSRLAKEVIDVLKVVDGQGKETNKDSIVFNVNERSAILEYSENILEKSWLWLINVMDTVEGQLYRGKHFDTKRYLISLQQGGDSESTGVSRASLNMPGATPEEYLMFLLRSHTNEHRDTLPVMDMLCIYQIVQSAFERNDRPYLRDGYADLMKRIDALPKSSVEELLSAISINNTSFCLSRNFGAESFNPSYEHAVYVLDAFFYVLNGWPKSGNSDNTETAMDICSSIEDENIKPNVDVAPSNISGNSSALLLDVTTRRFFLSATTDTTLDMFATELKHNLQQSARVYVPSVSLELFDKKNSMVDLEERIKLRDSSLPVSYRGLSSRELKLPIMHQWSADEVCERWMISIDIFSRLFLAEGPGGERDSFLATRAGTAGRIARFRRALSHLRDSVNTDQQQGIFGAYGFSGRMGTVLSLNVRRSHLLEDMLKFLGEMSSFHYTNFRVKFEGEEGSGPGVNRGFFAAVANALKADDKQPTGAASLLYEPGKLPEQSGYFSPRPSCRNDLLKQEPELLKRQTMFKSIGRFLGLCLWFSNTIPLNLTRTVIKYILGSEIVWQDLAFFNADLFDGLSRMIVDSMDDTISEETFQSTYCCHFEVSIARETVELVANGSHIPVTKSRTFEYARLYAQKVMVDCVQEELSAMKEGVHEIIPSELLEPLTTEDFQLLISGGTLDIDINRLKSITSFVNSNGCSSDILDRFKKWFWSIVNKMTPIQRQQLLYFATGSAMLPTMPERKENDQDDINITIDIIRGNPKALPMASTCGQRMSVPLYPSRRILKRKLLQAIQCQTYGLG